MHSEIDDQDVALGADLLWLIARLNRWSSGNADTRLPLAQARLLAWIQEHHSAGISDLARADNCTQPAMTVQVQRLEAAGLVQRARDPNDARAVMISLTDSGQSLLNEVRQARARAIAPVIARLNDAARRDLQTALAGLSLLLDTAAEEARAAQTPET